MHAKLFINYSAMSMMLLITGKVTTSNPCKFKKRDVAKLCRKILPAVGKESIAVVVA